MNSALEFHDSTIASAQVGDGALIVFFSAAYVHSSTGRPGVDSGEGFSQAVELRFNRAVFNGDPSRFHGKLSGGYLVALGDRHELVPVPFNYSGRVEAELAFIGGAVLRLESDGVTCVALGEATFVEQFPGPN